MNTKQNEETTTVENCSPLIAVLGRGKKRLEIARKLSKLPEGTDVMKYIEAMQPEEREHLRGLVDWVEEYVKYENSERAAIRQYEGSQTKEESEKEAFFEVTNKPI